MPSSEESPKLNCPIKLDTKGCCSENNARLFEMTINESGGMLTDGKMYSLLFFESLKTYEFRLIVAVVLLYNSIQSPALLPGMLLL